MASAAMAVVGVGALCPTGLDAAMITAATKAGISRKQESPLVDRAREPIVLGFLPDDVLPPLADALEKAVGLTSLERRLLRLAGPAMQEVRAATAFAKGAPLLLAGPESYPESAPVLQASFLGRLAEQAGVDVALDDSAIIAGGRAGVFNALRRARALLESGVPYVLVGGVDSGVDPMRLERLQDEERLLVPGVLDGFTPGEGAAVLLLSTAPTCSKDRVSPLAYIEAVGVADEPGHLYGDQPYRGDGLAGAFADLLTQTELGPSRRITTALAGFNGESYLAKEWGVTYLRNSEHFAEACPIEHPAEDSGDLGAALAPLMLVMAASRLDDGSLSGPVLVWAPSDGAPRGAAVIDGDNAQTIPQTSPSRRPARARSAANAHGRDARAPRSR